MVSGRFNTIALLMSVSQIRGRLLPRLLVSILAVLREQGVHLVLGDVGEVAPPPEQAPRLLRDWYADGLLINAISSMPASLLDLVGRPRVPSVGLNARLEYDCVYPDDFGAARRATEHLLKLGHRRIAYVDYMGGVHYSVADRRAGYEAAMAKAGLASRVVEDEGGPSAGWQALALKMLRCADRPTAVVAYEADRAMPVYAAACLLGLRMPQDLSLVTFHEKPVDMPGLPIDYLEIPVGEMGRVAVEMLLEKIASPKKRFPAVGLELAYRMGETCGPAPHLSG